MYCLSMALRESCGGGWCKSVGKVGRSCRRVLVKYLEVAEVSRRTLGGVCKEQPDSSTTRSRCFRVGDNGDSRSPRLVKVI